MSNGNPPNFIKQPKLVILADDEEFDVNDAARARRSIMRKDTMTKMVEDSLVNRVKEPVGVETMGVTIDELHRLQSDPEFVSSAKYMQNLLYYTDGRPRPVPIRPLVENEVGQWRGKIVVMKQNPDGMMIGIQAQVTHRLEGKIENLEISVNEPTPDTLPESPGTGLRAVDE